MPSFGAASRADGDTRLGVSLCCIQDRERRGRGRVRGDIVHHCFTALLSAGSTIAAEWETLQPIDFSDLSRKPAVTPLQLHQNDSCYCASKRFGIGVETRETPLITSVQTTVAQTNDGYDPKQSEGYWITGELL